MAARSRRSSTMASSMATQDLARQRTEMHIEAATWKTAGKRRASRPTQDREPKPKKPRRPRRWAPPGWDGDRWSARSIQPAGLETHHQPCMSSFISPEVPPSSTGSTGRLSWLRPRNSVSIWEHFAEVKRRADEPPVCGGVLASGIGMASVDLNNAPATVTVDQTIADSIDGPAPWGDGGGRQVPRFVAGTAASKRPAWPAASSLVATMSKSRQATASCASSSSTVDDANLQDVPAPQTPAVTCPADRVSIMSLVSGP